MISTVVRSPESISKTVRGFLPEVQALRAVAVILVVVYHLWPGRMPGGFVGVDVFFVISGFLITLHLLGSLLVSGRVNLLRFWANRIWRLLPAALLVLLACWVFIFLVAPVTIASNAFRQIGAASAYVINWVLAIDSVDYLARENLPTIVQHYWSLSVEEQFYVLWPLLLATIVLGGGSVAVRLGISVTRQRRATWLIAAILTLAAASFVYSVVATELMPSRAYFDTFARAWEFAAGGLLALIVVRFQRLVTKLRSHSLVSTWAVPQVLGLAMIVASGLFINSATPFPSGWAGIPVSGALLIMLGAVPRTPALAAAIVWRPVQFTGDISYSLYLWHWPLIIGFSMVAARRHFFWEGILLLAAAFLLAWLTKKWVEDPTRRAGRRTVALWPAFLVALLGAAVLVFGSTAVVQTRIAQSDATAAGQQQQLVDESGCIGANATLGVSECEKPFDFSSGARPAQPEKDLDPAWCLTWFDQDWLTCDFGDLSGPAGTVAIVGDSHAAALANPLGEYLESHGWRLETFTRYGCPALAQTRIGLPSQTPEMEQACADWSQRVLDELTGRSDISTVIFTSFESAYTQPTESGAAPITTSDIAATLGQVQESGKSVVLMRDFAATNGGDVPTCVASTTSPAVDCRVTRESAFPPGPFDQAVRDLGGRIRVVNTQAATCDEQFCYGLVGDVVVYADNNHVSETFARSLMPYLGPALLEGTPLAAEKGK